MNNMKFYEPGTGTLCVVKFNRHMMHAQEQGPWPARNGGGALTKAQVEDTMIRKGFTRKKPRKSGGGL